MVEMTDVLARALALHAKGKPEEALALLDRLLGKVIENPYIMFMVASCLTTLKLYGTAMQMYFRAIALALEQEKKTGQRVEWITEGWNNLGVCMRNETHDEEAIAAYQKALERDPNCEAAWSNFCGVYVNYGDPKTGIEIARRGLQLNRFNSQLGHHLAMMLLEDQQYEEGWRWYGSRLRIPEFTRRDYGENCPQWFGEELTGTLAIHGEQGIGDEIMFASLVGRAMQLAKRVLIECEPRLIPVLERSFPGVKCYGTHKELSDNERPDAWTALGNLPGIFKVYEPLEHSGYLKPDPERVAFWRAKYPGPRYGLSWRGGTRSTHEHLRNFEVEHWQKLVDAHPGCSWVSLQYGECDADIKRLGIAKPEVLSFDDHIALVASCDQVISICNTTIHEAGATNTPVLVLVPSKPAWRYGTRGPRMLWYPSATMFRQADKEPWPDVVQRAATYLSGIQSAKSKAA